MDLQELIVFITLCAILMCLIVVSSIVSIVVITRKSHFKNPRNFLLILLATSDLAIGVLVIPNVMFLTLNNSPEGGYICKACMFAEYMAVIAHTLTITALALDRFLAIRFPMKSRILRRRENYLIVTGAITFLSLLYGLRGPLLYQPIEKETIKENKTEIIYTCMVSDKTFNIHLAFVAVDFIVLFVLPSLVLIISNVKVSKTLRRTPFRTSSQSHASLHTRKKRRSMRLLLVMVVLFIVLNFPLHSFRLGILYYNQDLSQVDVIMHSFLILSFLYYVSNVFLYGLMNNELRLILNKVFRVGGLGGDSRATDTSVHYSSRNLSRNTNPS